MKFFPILFFTFILNGGLNQIILHFLFLFVLWLEKDKELLLLLLVLWLRNILLVYDNFAEYSLFNSATSYSAFDFSNTSWFPGWKSVLTVSHQLNFEFDNLWWVIWWGVDGHIIIWTVICSISKSNVMSKKSTIFKFVWMLVINSSVSKMDIIFFLQRSIVLPFAFLKTTNPSLGCNQLFFGAVIRYIITQVHTFLLCLDTP